MVLKRREEEVPFVDPPYPGWVHSMEKKYEHLKRVVPSMLEAERVESCSTGRIKEWYMRIQKEAVPAG